MIRSRFEQLHADADRVAGFAYPRGRIPSRCSGTAPTSTCSAMSWTLLVRACRTRWCRPRRRYSVPPIPSCLRTWAVPRSGPGCGRPVRRMSCASSSGASRSAPSRPKSSGACAPRPSASRREADPATPTPAPVQDRAPPALALNATAPAAADPPSSPPRSLGPNQTGSRSGISVTPRPRSGATVQLRPTSTSIRRPSGPTKTGRAALGRVKRRSRGTVRQMKGLLLPQIARLRVLGRGAVNLRTPPIQERGARSRQSGRGTRTRPHPRRTATTRLRPRSTTPRKPSAHERPPTSSARRPSSSARSRNGGKPGSGAAILRSMAQARGLNRSGNRINAGQRDSPRSHRRAVRPPRRAPRRRARRGTRPGSARPRGHPRGGRRAVRARSRSGSRRWARWG